MGFHAVIARAVSRLRFNMRPRRRITRVDRVNRSLTAARRPQLASNCVFFPIFPASLFVRKSYNDDLCQSVAISVIHELTSFVNVALLFALSVQYILIHFIFNRSSTLRSIAISSPSTDNLI
jgi:hypothetical protein